MGFLTGAVAFPVQYLQYIMKTANNFVYGTRRLAIYRNDEDCNSRREGKEQQDLGFAFSDTA